MQAAKFLERFNHGAAGGADEVPVHLEEAEFTGMQKQVDGFRFSDVLGSGKVQCVDAEERVVVGGTNMHIEFGRDARAPSAGFFEQGHPLVEQAVVKFRQGSHSARGASMSRQLIE